MDAASLIAQVGEFLERDLSGEPLSQSAEAARLRLLCLVRAHTQPAYLDMSRGSTLSQTNNNNTIIPRDCVDGRREDRVLHKGTLGRRRRRGFLWERTRRLTGEAREGVLCLQAPGGAPPTRIDLAGYSPRRVLHPNLPLAFELISPGSKTYQFVVESEEELRGWLSALTEACKERGMEVERQLPKVPPPPLPLQNQLQLYDTPRPLLQEYETMSPTQHYDTVPPSQDELYKNVGDSLYYNLIPNNPEQIYQTISDGKLVSETHYELVQPSR